LRIGLNITQVVIPHADIPLAEGLMTCGTCAPASTTPSWGWDLKANVAWIQPNPWLSLGPGLAIFITVPVFNLSGDGLRDALDPRLK
jgi:peptide/nickel transport system permease protein